MLAVGWLFFNAGSTMSMFQPSINSSSKIMMITLLSCSTGGIISAFLRPLIMGTYSQNQRYDVSALCNGMLAGCVSITGVCDRCEPWSAILIGLIGSLIYAFACKLWEYLNIDDPIEASQVHGSCGLWGIIAVGIFDG
jgi:ammonium transporter, Amt family